MVSNPESDNYSLLIAMDRWGIIGFMLFAGSVKTEDYIAFLYTLVENDLRDNAYKKTVFFMDNASIHTSNLFDESFLEDYRVLYNAPYSPHLNPIELAFGFMKREIRQAQPKSLQQLCKAICTVSQKVTINLIRSFVYSSLKHFSNCIELKDLV